MMFTWWNGFGELEEKVKFKNKNGSREMSQKQFSLFANKLEW